jgi:hypothetical protein
VYVAEAPAGAPVPPAPTVTTIGVEFATAKSIAFLNPPAPPPPPLQPPPPPPPATTKYSTLAGGGNITIKLVARLILPRTLKFWNVNAICKSKLKYY